MSSSSRNSCSDVIGLPDAAVKTWLMRDDVMLLSDAEKLCLLEEVEMLSPMPRASLSELARRAQVERVPKGQAVVSEGDLSPKLHVLVSGEAIALKRGRVMAHIHRWECFGELALFLRRPHEVSVFARTEAIVMTVMRDDLMATVRARPDEALSVLSSMTRMLRVRMQLPSAASW